MWSWRRVGSAFADLAVDLSGAGGSFAQAEAKSISRHLASKGFSVASVQFPSGLLEEALREVEDLEEKKLLVGVSSIIAEGLLGPEGSARLARAEAPEAEPAGPALAALGRALEDLGRLLEPGCPPPGHVLVHQAGEPLDDGGAGLVPAEAREWLETFRRHRVMLVLFLGPARGVLELRPHTDEEAEPYQVQTAPGTLVVLRPDLLSRVHVADGHSVALSRFLLAAAPHPRRQAAGRPSAPAAEGLEALLAEPRAAGPGAAEETDTEDLACLRQWQRAWVPGPGEGGQAVAVRSTACRFPCADELGAWYGSAVAGTDWAVEVPLLRWDHSEVYDPAPDSWQHGKAYCNHASFVDGVEWFDCQAFCLQVEEARKMDPHQRLTLEVGYAALCCMGKRRSTLRGWGCGVYVGCGNHEWLFVPPRDSARPLFAATAPGGQGACASRLSHLLGLQGPSLVLDAEAASGLAALHLACDSVRRRTPADADGACHALAVGVHLCLAPVWWPLHCASGWLSREGRCFTFDETADGYIRGEGCCAATVGRLSELAGDDAGAGHDAADVCADLPVVGCVAGAAMTSAGQGAGCSVGSGPADQQAMRAALRMARLEPLDVDCVEAHGVGLQLADAVEVGTLARVYRGQPGCREALPVAALKTACGHQLECGGLASLLEALAQAEAGALAPKPHLRRANPHLPLSGEKVLLVSEALELRDVSSYVGVTSRGFTGSTVHVVAWGQMPSPEVVQQALPAQDVIPFWPGGGGELEQDMRPIKAYAIVGSWSDWASPAHMEFEGRGSYGCTVMLGESAQEEFRILLDGDPDKVLHPGRPKAGPDCAVVGPCRAAEGAGSWLIGGRAEEGEESAPGDRHRVHLRVAGRWRSVTWERQGAALEALPPAPARHPAGEG